VYHTCGFEESSWTELERRDEYGNRELVCMVKVVDCNFKRSLESGDCSGLKRNLRCE